MFFLGLAVDYDGTIAQDDRVSEATIAALQRVKDSGRRLVLVTGRRLEAVIEAFPQYRLFDRLVVENGAVLHASLCARAHRRRLRLVGQFWQAGSPTRPFFSRLCASWDWKCRSSSTRAR